MRDMWPLVLPMLVMLAGVVVTRHMFGFKVAMAYLFGALLTFFGAVLFWHRAVEHSLE